MLQVTKQNLSNNFVYDIHLDGTVVNALGRNIISNTDGFNFKLPEKYRYNKENPYIGKGLNRNVVEGKEYTGFDADVAEFNDLFMRRSLILLLISLVRITVITSQKNHILMI